MHNCLASIQSGNRILQKCFTTLTNQKEEDITAITSVFLKHDKYVSDLWKIFGFLLILWFPPPINRKTVESTSKHPQS
jgi:hypothetical protein